MITYKFDTVIPDGKEKGMTVREAFEKNPRFVFETLKKWSADKVRNKTFSEDVLAEAKIIKITSEATIQQEEFKVPRSVVMDENGKVRRRKKVDDDDEYSKDEAYFYGPDYIEGAKDDNQEWGDGFDDEDDDW